MSSIWQTPVTTKHSRTKIRAADFTYHVSLIACILCLSACVRVVRPTVKIGLVAPFEGRYREIGYEVIHAVRLAVREANLANAEQDYSVELVSLDDGGDPIQARAQAKKLLADPQVVGVLGHWLDETTLAASPLYASSGIPLLATSSAKQIPVSSSGVFRLYPTESLIIQEMSNAAALASGGTTCFCDVIEGVQWLESSQDQLAVGGPLWGLRQFMLLMPDNVEVRFVTPAPVPRYANGGKDFSKRYRAISHGVEPGWLAVLAYDGARTMLAAIANSSDHPTATTVALRLAQESLVGLSGPISFNQDGDLRHSHLFLYRWENGKIVP